MAHCGLTARGLSGVRLVISDAHPGLVNAIAACLRKNIKWISPACQAQFGYRASK